MLVLPGLLGGAPYAQSGLSPSRDEVELFLVDRLVRAGASYFARNGANMPSPKRNRQKTTYRRC